MITFTAEQLHSLSPELLAQIILDQQRQLKLQTEQISRLNDQMERLIEQIRIANANRFGRKTERLDAIDGQLCLFNEAEVCADPEAPEPEIEETVKSYKRKKQKGKRDEDLSGLPSEPHVHDIPEEKLNAFYGEGCWRKMTEEHHRKLRCEPATYTVEDHIVYVYVGTKGDHQDEFLRGDRPKDLVEKSIVTPSLGAAIINGKYVNSLPLNRISQELERNEIHISRQTMGNWMLHFAKYFGPLCERMKQELLSLPVTQADETPLLVVRGDPEAGEEPFLSRNNYMWVHRSGEYYRDRPIILYEYQHGRNHKFPLEYYKDYHGVLVTDSLQQYHIVERELKGVTNANCWAHARRAFADACKALGPKNPALKTCTAHQALELIGGIYEADGALKEWSREERYQQRQVTVKPLVEAFFAWVREKLDSNTLLPKSKTVEGLNFCRNQEQYLKVFLQDGDVPIDNSASERAIRTFCIGKKNWVLQSSSKGARASAVLYSVSETAKANNLKPYQNFKHLLTELPERADKDGNIDPSGLDDLLPWSKTLPEECYKRR